MRNRTWPICNYVLALNHSYGSMLLVASLVQQKPSRVVDAFEG